MKDEINEDEGGKEGGKRGKDGRDEGRKMKE
jgi:hypothetical protein